MNMQDRVVLLTGGAGPNMGGALASAFAKAGATLIIADLNGEEAEKTAGELRQTGAAVTGVELNAADRKACVETVEKVVRDHGRIDVLFNHAGYISSMSAVGNTPDEEWDLALAVNMTAPFVLAHAALPHMLENGRGVITNTISEAGLRAGAAGAAYTASKHGLVGLTRSLAWAYGKAGLRCNGICPGGTTTMDLGDPATVQLPFPAGSPYDFARMEPVMRAAVRFLRPDEIAQMGLFLSSDAASGVNGQIIAVDAGWAVG